MQAQRRGPAGGVGRAGIGRLAAARQHLLRGQGQDGGEQAIEEFRGNDADEEHAGQRAERGGRFEHDGEPDVGQAAFEEGRRAAARAGDHRNDAGADGDVDVDTEQQRQDGYDENAAGHAQHAAQRAGAERRGEKPEDPGRVHHALRASRDKRVENRIRSPR
ncbi:hypothetical protein FQZ97_748740 [compost metagenome]